MATSAALHWALNLLILQGLLGARDTIYHQELTEKLPQRPGAAPELRIHGVRALLYGLLFLTVARFAFHGLWGLAIAALVLVEVVLTLQDFVVEDGSRKLPASERIMHTVLAINGGALFALYGWQLGLWWSLPTALVPLDSGWRSWVLMAFAAGVMLSGLRDLLAARQLRRRSRTENPFAQLAFRRVLVTGGTGFIGEALVAQLLAAGHAVTLLTRDPLRAAYLFTGRTRSVRDLGELDAAEIFDVVINLAGAPVVGLPWGAARKAQLLDSRVNTTQALGCWLEKAQHKPTLWVQASAIGFYGVRDPAEALAEGSMAGEGFMAELCQRWEAAAAGAAVGVRQVVLRLGLVFGPGGALPPLLLPFRCGLGGRLGDGRQVMSWIHRDDVPGLIAEAMSNDAMQGIYNAVAPQTVTQAEFARQVGHVLHRPVWLHLPAAPIRLLAGEMAQLFVDRQRVFPECVQAAGYAFRFPALAKALRDVIG